MLFHYLYKSNDFLKFLCSIINFCKKWVFKDLPELLIIFDYKQFFQYNWKFLVPLYLSSRNKESIYLYYCYLYPYLVSKTKENTGINCIRFEAQQNFADHNCPWTNINKIRSILVGWKHYPCMHVQIIMPEIMKEKTAPETTFLFS